MRIGLEFVLIREIRIKLFLPLVPDYEPAPLFFLGHMRLIRQHPLFRPAAPASFLAANFFRAGLLSRHRSRLQPLDFIEQKSPRHEPIQALLPGGLAFDPQPGRPMQQHDASRALIDVLPTMTPRPHERFLKVCLIHPQS